MENEFVVVMEMIGELWRNRTRESSWAVHYPPLYIKGGCLDVVILFFIRTSRSLQWTTQPRHNAGSRERSSQPVTLEPRIQRQSRPNMDRTSAPFGQVNGANGS